MIEIEDVKRLSKDLWQSCDEVTVFDVLIVLDELIGLIEERLDE